jgi:predicted dehydrogenase
MNHLTRRTFVKSAAALSAASAIPAFAVGAPRDRRGDELRVGVIGCGGRGTGAAVDALNADPGVRIVAMADVFPDRLAGSLSALGGHDEGALKDRLDVPGSRQFTGFDGYRELLQAVEIDYVILATPPHFRPIHFEAAVNAGRHVFMEKPVAVDPAGVRRVLAAAERADVHGLSVVTGTQRRHEDCYLAAMERIRDGAIGEVVSARAYWNQGALWHHPRKPEYTDMEWQLRNWLYFTWLSGDHICEQHIHNLDVINWVMGGPPERAMGMGGREVRTGPEFGHIFDHFAIEYEYPSGAHLISMARQIPGCADRVMEIIHGTEGQMRSGHGWAEIRRAGETWKAPADRRSPYLQEHIDLIASIKGDHPRLSEAKVTAESTLTAIMGRMSAYTGKEVTWEQAMNSKLELSPEAYEFGPLPTPEVAVPGRTPLI